MKSMKKALIFNPLMGYGAVHLSVTAQIDYF
jgi:hypothetical protein